MNTLTFNGNVVAGQGSGKKFLDLPWVKLQVEEKLGFTPYPGTLNLQLLNEGARQRELLLKKKNIEICPAEGYCTGAVFIARINGLDCAIVMPKVPGYPKSILEIIAPVNLRETLRLKDGDAVQVTVTV